MASSGWNRAVSPAVTGEVGPGTQVTGKALDAVLG